MSESTKSREELLAEIRELRAELARLLAPRTAETQPSRTSPVEPSAVAPQDRQGPAGPRRQPVIQAILNACLSALVLVDPDGRIEAANAKVADFFAIDHNALTGEDLFTFIKQIKPCFERPTRLVALVYQLHQHPDLPPSTADDSMQVLSRCLHVTSPVSRDLAPFAWAIRDAGGTEVGRLWTFVDATRLRESEEQLHKLVEASPVPLIITRLSDGHILFANRELAAMINVTPQNLIGRESPDFYFDPEDRVRVIQGLQQTGMVKHHEVRLKRLDGSFFWASLSLVLTEIGGEPAVIGGVIDIDQRKRIEEALRVSEARFRGLVENADDIIFSATPEGRITYISPKFLEITGHDPKVFLGLPMTALVGSERDSVHPSDLGRATAAFSSRRPDLGRDGVATSEYRMKHRDGSWRWFVAHASEIRDAGGEVVEIVGVAHDVTSLRLVLEDLEKANADLRQTQAQLVQSEKMAALGTLVAGIAHEINTPVGAISSMHDTLEKALQKLRARFADVVEQDSKAARLFDALDNASSVIDSGSTRVREIVRRLRSFARLDEAVLAETDLHEGIEDTLVLVHHELKGRIQVHKRYGSIPRVTCYPSQLNQVFLNLLINASQAISGTGDITIETALHAKQVHISVHDTGSGIPKQNLSRIFDPGFTTKGVGVGTGLGLSICYQIIKAHRGEIEVDSEVGRGTTFTVIIPTNLRALLEAEA